MWIKPVVHRKRQRAAEMKRDNERILHLLNTRVVFMRYEALGPGMDGAASKTSSALANFITNSLCVYVCVWGRWV